MGAGQRMERSSVPEPLTAAKHLESARTSIAEAVRALNRRETAPLVELVATLGQMAAHFREHRLLAGLNVPIVSAKNGARALGKSRSPDKLAALARAREKLAEKRQREWEQRHGRRFVPKKAI